MSPPDTESTDSTATTDGDADADVNADSTEFGAVHTGGSLVRRRPVVAAASVGLLEGLFGACLGLFDGDGSEATPQPTPTPEQTATDAPNERSIDPQALAEQFAPDIYFDADERWFPTDPRSYTSKREGQTVVDGFDALNQYVDAFDSPDAPPAPAVFYHVVTPAEGVAVVEYWFYSVFDQFTTNFHWHDWELLSVWIDVSDEPTPVLAVGSAHARSMPNNEFLRPPSTVSVIAELGSHSSAIGVNRTRDRFERTARDGETADVTNAPVTTVAGGDRLPLAYGLPRDEGFAIPYVVPELDGEPLYDHDRLSLDAADLLPASLSVDSLADLNRPLSSFPTRRTGLQFGFDDGDVAYDLLPIETVTHIEEFAGPQLSFPFAIPGFVEDQIAHHISSADFPWSGNPDQRRFEEPIHDVTDAAHREALAGYGVDVPETGGTVVAGVLSMGEAAGETAGVALSALGTEVVALFESEPTAIPSSNGRLLLVDVPAGEHRLVVNGAGYAPYARRLTVDFDSGRERLGQVALVENADAFKLGVDASARGGARRVRVDDDVGGTVYDAPPVEENGRSAVYLHRAGAYVVEVTDSQGETSVERVRPRGSGEPREVGAGATGKASIVDTVFEILLETRREFEAEREELELGQRETDDSPLDEVARRLDAATEAVEEAISLVDEGLSTEADARLETARDQLTVVRTVTRDADTGTFPTALKRLVLRRVQQAQTRIRDALAVD
jgi:hypothetical protein